jgi:hypothetical protein
MRLSPSILVWVVSQHLGQERINGIVLCAPNLDTKAPKMNADLSGLCRSESAAETYGATKRAATDHAAARGSFLAHRVFKTWRGNGPECDEFT